MQDAKPDLLFLCHRIPFPPDKGDKIRSYHWLRALSDSYRVHLAAFVDDPFDWAHEETVQELCASCLLLPLEARRAKLRSLVGLVVGQPLSLPYYRDRRLSLWLRVLRREVEPSRVFVYSSAMAQYAVGSGWAGSRRIIDFVDVDSDKWRQYAERMRRPMRWIYAREARRLESFDRSIARSFDVSLFVSAAEAAWFRDCLGEGGEKVTHVNNGVDAAYFDPRLDFESPYAAGVRAVVFTGAMDYWANVDAVSWFSHEVWPRVLARVPSAVFHIVGSRPQESVNILASRHVVVTGRVPDVRPFLRHAAAVVAPMRIARGIQNKVLEGMAMARPVVVSSKGLEGIMAENGKEVLVADDAADFAQCLIALLVDGESGIGNAARDLVRRVYSWERNAARLVNLMEGVLPDCGRPAVDSVELV